MTTTTPTSSSEEAESKNGGFDPVLVGEIKIESRYHQLHELELMTRALRGLPAALCAQGKRAKSALRNGSGRHMPLLASAYPSRMLSFTPIPSHLGNIGLTCSAPQ